MHVHATMCTTHTCTNAHAPPHTHTYAHTTTCTATHEHPHNHKHTCICMRHTHAVHTCNYVHTHTYLPTNTCTQCAPHSTDTRAHTCTMHMSSQCLKRQPAAELTACLCAECKPSGCRPSVAPCRLLSARSSDGGTRSHRALADPRRSPGSQPPRLSILCVLIVGGGVSVLRK